MRSWLLIIIITISSNVYSQTRSDPFVGGIEFALGYGSVIDFNLENNNFDSEYLLKRLIWLPFQIGLVSAKYLNPNEYFEIGMMLARRSSSFVNRNIYSVGLPVLELYSIDFPLKYYANAGKILNHTMYAYGGLIPSWIFKPEMGSGYNVIPEGSIRNFYISVCGGLCYDKKKSRMKLHAGLAGFFRKVVIKEVVSLGLIVNEFKFE